MGLAQSLWHTLSWDRTSFFKRWYIQQRIEHRSSWSTMYSRSDLGPSPHTTHRGTHAGQGMRNTGLLWVMENVVCMMLGHGSQGRGLEIQQRDRLPGRRRTLSMSAWGFSTKQQEPICSSHKGLSVFLPPPPCLFLCQRVGVSRTSGAQGTLYHPTSSDRGQGLGPRQTMTQKEPARPPDPFSGR